MPRNGSAPALGVNESQGGNVVFAGDRDRSIITAARIQRLNRLGIPFNRAALLAGLVFGEGATHA